MTNLEFLTDSLSYCIQQLQEHYDEDCDYDQDDELYQRLRECRRALRASYFFVEESFDTEDEAQARVEDIGNLAPVVERKRTLVVIHGTVGNLVDLGFREQHLRNRLFKEKAS